MKNYSVIALLGLALLALTPKPSHAYPFYQGGRWYSKRTFNVLVRTDSRCPENYKKGGCKDNSLCKGEALESAEQTIEKGTTITVTGKFHAEASAGISAEAWKLTKIEGTMSTSVELSGSYESKNTDTVHLKALLPANTCGQGVIMLLTKDNRWDESYKVPGISVPFTRTKTQRNVTYISEVKGCLWQDNTPYSLYKQGTIDKNGVASSSSTDKSW